MARAPVPDKCFPRGGVKPKKWRSVDADFSLFKAKKTKGVKRKHSKSRPKKGSSSASEKILEAVAVKDLKPGDVRPGVVILGCVDKITDLSVQLSLPGNMRAIVSAVNISSQFTAMIGKQDCEVPALSEIFEMGEQFPVVILEKCDDSLLKFKASLDPKEVNSKLSSRFLQRGMILTGSIVSLEEHGYVVDLGIPKVTAFLLRDNTPPDVSYCEGRLVRVALKSVSSDHHTVQLSSKISNKSLSDIDSELPIICFVPGFRWKLMVTRDLKSGLEVALKGFGPDIKGYVHANHLRMLFDTIHEYPEGSELDGTLLYVLPVLNYPFFRVTEQEKPTWGISFGSLVKNVKVVRSSKRGLIGKIDRPSGKEKCFIPVNKINEHEKIIAEEAEIKELYPVGSVLPLVRIERPSRLSRWYFGAIDKESLRDQLYSKNELRVGQMVNCRMAVVGRKYCTVELSRYVKGFVPSAHVTDSLTGNYSTKFRPGQMVKARVLAIRNSDERVRLTLKPSLLKTNPILTEKTNIQAGTAYLGTVLRVDGSKVFVEFFGGRVEEIETSKVRRGGSPSYQIGQLVRCYVVADATGTLTLSLVCNSDVAQCMNVGFQYPATISYVADEGLYLGVQAQTDVICQGFLPRELISSNKGIASQLMDVYSEGDSISVFCVHVDPLRHPASLLATHPTISAFYKEKLKNSRQLERGAIVPCIYLPGDGNQLELSLVVPHSADVTFLDVSTDKKHSPTEFQVVLAKIKTVTTKKIICSSKLETVWDHHYMSSLKDVACFLAEIKAIQLKMKRKKNCLLAGIELGQAVEATAFRTVQGSPTVLKLKSAKLVQARCWAKFDATADITGRVVWVDYLDRIVWVQPFQNNEVVHTKLETRALVRAKVVHVCPDVVVADATGSRELLFIPTRRHINDLATYEAAYCVGEMTRLCVHRLESRLIGIDRQIVRKTERRMASKGAASSPKRQKLDKTLDHAQENSETEDDNTKEVDENGEDAEMNVSIEYVKTGSGIEPNPIKQEVLSDEEAQPLVINTVGEDFDSEVKSECDSKDDFATAPENDISDSDSEVPEVKEEPAAALDVAFDWSVAENPHLLRTAWSRAAEIESSSDEEEEVDVSEKKKRKRLSGTEKKEKARETEERLRSREQQLVDPTRPPQSPDDFDRLVVARPDDSAVWLQYMAHHLENTEIEKARGVARRALKVISFREEQEKLNVWFALLNLEQLYGTTESQKSVLDEALRCNDPYKVHLHKLTMLVDAGAGLEAEQLGNTMLRKYGEAEPVWWEVGGALMRLGKLDFARKVLQRAMSSLPNSKHVAVITRFAQLENKFGSSERGQTLYEQVLTAFPKRVDVWSAYVDLMVKSGRIDLARQILERATSQSLPPKKMKGLFKKFVAFEETHGTPENVDRVRQAASEFLEAIQEEDKKFS